MDDRSFDRLARLLGEARDRRTGLKALVGGLLGAGGLAARHVDADAKRKDKGKDKDKGTGRDDAGPDAGKRKRRKRCKPACDAGFACVKGKCVCQTGVLCGESCCALGQSCVGGQCRAAACDPACTNGYACEGTTCICPSGIECGAACCAAGQTCENGACAGEPDPGSCVPAGERCKNVGRACCPGRVCASGQGGERDVACYVPKSGACTATAECVYGMECRDGRCQPPPPGGLGQPCGGGDQRLCTVGICQAYTGPGAPSGSYCSLPLQAGCTRNAQCAGYSCGYPTEAMPGTVGPTCCNQLGDTCGSDRDCCEGSTCGGGKCVSSPCTVCTGGGCAYTTIKDAIDKGETDIRIAGGRYEERDLPVPASLTLRACSASPVTIDAQQGGRIMAPVTDGKTVTIERIRLRNGRITTTDGGGALHGEAGSTIKLIGVTIANCESTDTSESSNCGGAVYSAGIVEVRDSLITGCQCGSNDEGGAGFSGGEDSTIKLYGVTIDDCHAPDAYGGAVFSYGVVEVRNSVISGCSAYYGGGIAVYDDASSLTIEGSTITECSGDYGAGIYTYAAPLKITDSTVSDCINPVEEGYGGGIYAEDAVVEMVRARITGNRVGEASYSDGGGVYMYDSEGSLTNCVIENNRAGRGGGLMIYGSSGPIDITGGSMSYNEVDYENDEAGGGLYLYPDYLVTVKDVTIAGNTVTAPNAGVGVYVYGDVTFTGSTKIMDNIATTTDTDGGGLYVESGTVTLESTTEVSGNKVGGDGGGIYVYAGTLNVEGKVRNNTATGNGGGIYNYYGTLGVTGSAAITANGAATGGGIYNEWKVNLSGSAEIRDNTATDGDGVGIYHYAATYADAEVTCTGTPKVCSNPTASPTGASNCYRDGTTGGDFVDCSAVCKSSPATC